MTYVDRRLKLYQMLTSVAQNYRKMMGSMYHNMRDDPRRRAAYGMTVENDKAMFWYGSRAEIVVSEPFNFQTVHIISLSITEQTY